MVITQMLYKWKRDMTEKAALTLQPRNYYCSICNEKFAFFGSCGENSELFKHCDIVGGGRRKHVVCPRCGSNDRNRWVDYCLKKYTDVYESSPKVLHIAPEPCIEKKIRLGNKNYVTGDICPGTADKVVDVTKMSMPDESFDYIIINHVLEHISDDSAALNEIWRTLKKEGCFIFSMPICIELDKTYELQREMTDAERLKEYGQKDHFRLYGKDVIERVEKFGFRVKKYRPQDMLSDQEIERLNVIKNDTLFMGEKVITDRSASQYTEKET